MDVILEVMAQGSKPDYSSISFYWKAIVYSFRAENFIWWFAIIRDFLLKIIIYPKLELRITSIKSFLQTFEVPKKSCDASSSPKNCRDIS